MGKGRAYTGGACSQALSPRVFVDLFKYKITATIIAPIGVITTHKNNQSIMCAKTFIMVVNIFIVLLYYKTQKE